VYLAVCGSIMVASWKSTRISSDVAAIMNNVPSAEAAPRQPEPDIAGATAACEKFVTDKLKAPATAKFQRGVFAQHVGGARFHFLSYVDAENSFGANMRTNFTCEVSDLGAQWRLDSLSVRGR
jgi:hypothetical protein